MAALLLASAALRAEPLDTITLTHAELDSARGSHPVTLPHQLGADDFAPRGDRVRYRLLVPLPAQPVAPVGVYVLRLSLSGRLSINGREFMACGHGPLEQQRCLYRPQMFQVPADYWQSGDNTLEFELYANDQQMNGLSEVQVGDVQTLVSTHLQPDTFWRVDLIAALAWISGLLGVLSLCVAMALRQTSPWLWFGLSNLDWALVKSTILATGPWFSPAFFSWLALASRTSTGALMSVAALAIFPRSRANTWLQRLLVGYALTSPAWVWLLDMQRQQVGLLYLLLLLLGIAVLVFMACWTWRSRKPSHALVTAIILSLYAVGLLDVLRFMNKAQFTGMYLAPYAQTGLSLIFAALLFDILARALQRLRQQGEAMELSIHHQSQQLRLAKQRISSMERTLLKLTENIPVGTYVIETNALQEPKFTFVSDRFLHMLEVRRDEVLADPGVGFRRIHPEEFERFVALNLEVFRNITPFQWEGRALVRGEVRWMHIESVPRRLENGGAAWEGVMIDITEQKLAQKALEVANRQLLAGEVERSRQEERDRLLQDMHDGFGSQLASARLLAERGEMSPAQMARVLQECMADLYLVIDTLGASSGDLAQALADFRFRTGQRLGQPGLQLHWNLNLDGASSPP
jgi:PAS domain S-box-containing protein